MNIQVLFEDEVLLIINKPAGITVNKSDTTHNEVTVQDWAEEHIDLIKKSDDALEIKHYTDSEYDPKQGFYQRGGIVHRLDKETSGILLIAKNPEAFVALQEQFKERTVHKTYKALVHGRVLPENGEIRVPVGRLPWDRKRFGIVAGGRESVTKYTTLKKYFLESKKNKEPLTMLELYPETGRTHQIRVHMKYINRPIFADFLYAGRKVSRDDRAYLSRVFLHAAGISFLHPVTKKDMILTCPFPVELDEFIQTKLTEDL